MLINKRIPLKIIFQWSAIHVLWLISLMAFMTALYHFSYIRFSIPWIPVSVIGTAVAFYVGFKNNQSYDRMWEARKIWGGIVNDSRTWGMMVNGYVNNQFNENQRSKEELQNIKKTLIYRHIAWLYAHRNQLLIPTPWEHVSQTGHEKRTAELYQRKFGVGLIDDEITEKELHQFLCDEEFKRLINYKNTATQIINEQSKHLEKLRTENVIDDFRLVQMMDILRTFYELQGKNERIKKFPLPRQYANMSRWFTGIFVTLLPFTMIPELLKLGNWGIWVAAPITALVGWVYVMMEIVGDYSENPFQGMANDIPMLSLCRTIEIDLREMLYETNLPPAIQSKNGILM
ncbi:MAG: bestrophin family ion channel [Chitinophagales bacterium]